ncbi:MAG: deoxyguanosinetriphosphate triphosphohydrolase [Alphaproteobacteria bacterium]|nr:deoxyguanosinetriphosphate triphosphohydrolase [Alphaproteobacteria bacterium]
MPLAPYACDPRASRGRRHPEPSPAERSEFQRDRDRIIHCVAFRRLKHKTQVFIEHEGDHFRTRLTHSLEVAQIARSIARSLGLDEDLSEALALAHDLGHTCFGHAGEDVLDEQMKPFGGFDHNDQTFRILTHLERRYAEFDGLNLTWETLEGTVKHNGPLIGGKEPVPPTIAAYDVDLWLDSYASAEAQVAALSDDIAYNNHDIDDGLRAGLFHLEEIEHLGLIRDVLKGIRTRYPVLDYVRLHGELVRQMIGRMVQDVLVETRRRLTEAKPASADEIRRLARPIVAFSDEMRRHDRELKAFLHERMYRAERVRLAREDAHAVVRDLFQLFLADPGRLPAEWSAATKGQDRTETARIVADYIAGMTDRYAFAEHARLVTDRTIKNESLQLFP